MTKYHSIKISNEKIVPPNLLLIILLLLPAVSLQVGCATSTTTKPSAINGKPLSDKYVQMVQDPDQRTQLRTEAVEYLKKMTESSYAGYRANAIEALADEPTIGEEVARTGLLDDNPGVRFTSAMIIGTHQFSNSAPLVHALLKDDNGSVRIDAIFALARNGIKTNITLLADYLNSNNLTERSNAALALGELGDPSAIQMLREALNDTNPRATVAEQRLSDLQIAEAMVKLGDDEAISRIRAQLRGASPEDGEAAALAATILGNLNAKIYQRDLVNMVAAWKEFRNSAEVRLAAVGALVKMGQNMPIDIPLEYFSKQYTDTFPSEFMAVREQATYTLGLIATPDALAQIANIYHETSEESVRLQAAAALISIISAEESPGINTEIGE